MLGRDSDGGGGDTCPPRLSLALGAHVGVSLLYLPLYPSFYIISFCMVVVVTILIVFMVVTVMIEGGDVTVDYDSGCISGGDNNGDGGGPMYSFVLGAVTPAVIVPCMLVLSQKGYGVDKGIPTLVIAASSIDDVLAISGFGVLMGITFAEG